MKIVTNIEIIHNKMHEYARPIAENIIMLISARDRISDYYLRLYNVCSFLCHMGELAYEYETQISKPDREQYKKRLFEYYISSVEDVKSTLENSGYRDVAESEGEVKRIFQYYRIIANLWSDVLACDMEEAASSVYAFIFEYTMENGLEKRNAERVAEFFDIIERR